MELTITLPDFICSASQSFSWGNIVLWTFAGLGLISLLLWLLKFFPRCCYD